MQILLSESLDRREAERNPVRVAVVGAGFIGRALVRRLSRMRGVRVALVANRTVDRALEAWGLAGAAPERVLVTDDDEAASLAVEAGRPVASSAPGIAARVGAVDVVAEVTSSIEASAREALACIAARKDLVTFSAETDATVGCILRAKALRAGSGYAVGQGDQPAVLGGLLEDVRQMGFSPELAVNCKGFLDVSATPATVGDWSARQGTSLRMTSAFTDGTKMQIEQNVVANATGLLPAKRGMTGVKTDLAHALADLERAGCYERGPAVEYTVGGDFKAGVFVVGRSEDPELDAPYLKYLKMGDGPRYLFYFPWHLCHLQLAVSVAEMALFHRTGISALGAPMARTVAVAKRDLGPGEVLDGIGGFAVYGEVAREVEASGLLPIGVSEGAVLTRPVGKGEPVPVDSVELDEGALAVRLWREQEAALGNRRGRAGVSPA